MLTRYHWTLMLVLIALPFVLLLLLILVNPGYMTDLFTPLGPISGMSLVVALQLVNFALLYLGLSWATSRQPSAAPPKRLTRAGLALVVLTFIVFTLPSLWLVLFYPSVIRLLRADFPS